MKLVADWRRVLKRAWSIRLMILAGILSGLEVIFSLSDIADHLDWPQGIFAALSSLTTAAAFVARSIVQNGVSNKADDKDQTQEGQYGSHGGGRACSGMGRRRRYGRSL